ncbi:hypothetical protein Cme02nite_06170 [Catellatospora methionotrophica]|uniref:Uncharacterized protein n=1 Tax=Catellatospora methionotrophica TaxID=121620 RepID=A0A8J3LGN0_9ACTN|nr:hypothetical protein Cme02nite_06170 [Catellatospora methionotrophica]
MPAGSRPNRAKRTSGSKVPGACAGGVVPNATGTTGTSATRADLLAAPGLGVAGPVAVSPGCDALTATPVTSSAAQPAIAHRAAPRRRGAWGADAVTSGEAYGSGSWLMAVSVIGRGGAAL